MTQTQLLYIAALPTCFILGFAACALLVSWATEEE